MPRKSHRRRQRERAQRREARPRFPFWTGADGGELRRNDLATITRAVRSDWPIPPEARPDIVAAVVSSAESSDPRTVLAAARAAIAMAESNARGAGGAA